MEEEEDDDLELFGGYDSFRSYNSSAGSESSSYLEESSDAENEDREAGELPTSPLPLLSPGQPRSLDGSGSEPGAFTVSLKMGSSWGAGGCGMDGQRPWGQSHTDIEGSVLSCSLVSKSLTARVCAAALVR